MRYPSTPELLSVFPSLAPISGVCVSNIASNSTGKPTIIGVAARFAIPSAAPVPNETVQNGRYRTIKSHIDRRFAGVFQRISRRPVKAKKARPLVSIRDHRTQRGDRSDCEPGLRSCPSLQELAPAPQDRLACDFRRSLSVVVRASDGGVEIYARRPLFAKTSSGYRAMI